VKVLVACEFSGIVRDAFIDAGHDAVSVDLLPSERPGPHYEGRIEDYLRTKVGLFVTDADEMRWDIDLLVAHPPCRYLAVSGARWMKDRPKETADALAFVKLLASLRIPRIAIENPVSILSTHWRKPDQWIEPWMFGHGETKKTGLWLKNLPLLVPTDIVDGRQPRVHYASPGPDRWKERSRTLPGIAAAMAAQWGSL